MTLRRARTVGLAVCVVLATAIIGGSLSLLGKMNEDSQATLMKSEAREIADYILCCKESKGPLTGVMASASNSTEVMTALLPALRDARDWASLDRIMARKVLSSRVERFATSNNIWIIAKNVSTNAPGQVVVVATRNIDACSLRTQLNTADMSKQVSLRLERESGILKKYAIIVRKDGRAVILRPRREHWWSMSRQFPRYDYVYDATPFDGGSSGTNEATITYLTPDGEITPRNR